MDGDGHLYFENQWCDDDRLKQRLQAAVDRSPEPLTLVVQLDKNAKAEVYLRLGLLARSVGIRRLWQAARPSVVPVPAVVTP